MTQESKTIRVLHCCYSLAGGGAETQLALLSELSKDYGIVSATFYVEERGAVVKPGRLLFKHTRNHRWDFAIVLSVCRAIEEFEPDLIHCWLPPVVTIPALLASKVKRKPAIISYRSAKRFHGWLSVSEFVTALFLAKGVISNTSLHTCSPLHQRLFNWLRGVVVPNGVERFKEVLKAPRLLESNPKKMSLLFVGRILPVKNWQTLVRALLLIDESVDWKLTVCGEGPERSRFEDEVRETGLTDRVSFLGYSQKVLIEISKADLLIMPSWSEGMPNVVLEAMSLGTATLLSDIPAHRRITEGESIDFFPAGDSEFLARKVTHLYRNPSELISLSSKGKRIAARYSPEMMVSSFRDYYSSILEDR